MASSPIHQSTAGRRFSSLRVTYEAQYGIQTRHELENSQQSYLPSIRERSSGNKTENSQENNGINSSDYQPTTQLRTTSNAQYIQGVPYIVPTSCQPVIATSNTRPPSSDISECPIIRHYSNNIPVSSPYNIDNGERTLALDRQLHLVYVAEENLRHRVNVELENTRTTLQNIISEQFVTLHKTLRSSDHCYAGGYEYPGPTQDIDGYQPHTYQSADKVLVPESEGLIEAVEPFEQAHEMLTESCQPSEIPSPQDSGVSCCEHTLIDSIEHQLDHYVLRMQTAVSVINNTLLKYN